MPNPKFTRRAIFWTATLAFLLPTMWMENNILQHTRGAVAYPSDNAYLHLAVAKNFAFDHTWSVNDDGFNSASPSPLYTFILAVVLLVTGAYSFVPLAVNIVVALFFLRAVRRWLERQQMTAKNQLLILLGIILLTPLPIMVISGMEYTLQLLFSFLFLYSFSAGTNPTAATTNPTALTILPRKTYLYAALMMTTSYETLPILLLACLVLLFRRQYWETFKLFFIALLPLYLFGLFALTQQNYFIPNSLLLAWGKPHLTAQWLPLLFLPAIYLVFDSILRRHPAWNSSFLILLGTAVVLPFIPTSNPSWLIGCALPLCATLIVKNHHDIRFPKFRWASAAFILLAAIPFLWNSATAYTGTQRSFANNTVQYQAAKFVECYYSGENVASNEIGAVSFWMQTGRIFDLAGIGNTQVLTYIRQHTWTPAFADSLSEQRNVKIAVLHHFWTDADTDPYWYKIACWQTPTDSVSFYSIDNRGISELQEDLHAYQPHLPAGITVRYYKPML